MSEYETGKGAARADLCRYLSACYYEPGPEFGEEKVFDSMLAAAQAVDPRLVGHVRGMAEDFASQGHEGLLPDYARLFLGPVDVIAQPYESAWREGSGASPGESALPILELYRAGGFEIGEGFHDLPDHVACELEYLYLLLHREAEGRALGDGEEVTEAIAARKLLLDEHLGRWIGPFTAAVAAGAQSAYYRELAALTARVVELEANRR